MNEAFKSIRQGLEEAISFSKGERPKAVAHEFSSVDVKNLKVQR